MFAARIPVLAQCRLEHRRRQSAQLEGWLVPQDAKPRLGLPPLTSAQHPSGPLRFQFYQRFQFRQDGDDDRGLFVNRAPDHFARWLGMKHFEQATSITMLSVY